MFKPIRLNVGCGKDIRTGYINIDFEPAEGVDMVIDISKCKLPFKDNSVDEILLSHVLEHIPNRYKFIMECWRVLKPNGILHVKLPAKWVRIEHESYEHTKDYFYTVCNEDKKSGVQGKKLFNLVYQKRHLHSIWNLLIRFRDWFLNLFTDEWEYVLRKVKK